MRGPPQHETPALPRTPDQSAKRRRCQCTLPIQMGTATGRRLGIGFDVLIDFCCMTQGGTKPC